ncbi:MAG: thioredoxin [Lachnospiraceae bacterium]|nr:thioredoxin [Lachnospiraceae bacterium]
MVKKVNNLTDAKAAKVAVVDFSATWCGPCKMLGPVMDQLSDEMSEAEFYNIDVDEAQKEAEEFSVMSIPLLVVLKDGKEVARQVGFQPKDGVKAFIQDAISK